MHDCHKAQCPSEKDGEKDKIDNEEKKAKLLYMLLASMRKKASVKVPYIVTPNNLFINGWNEIW